MSSARSFSPALYLAVLGTAAILAPGAAPAQVASSTASLQAVPLSPTESSSTEWAFAASSSPEAAAASPEPANGGGQYDNKSGGGGGRLSHLTWEAGAGFNAPIGNDLPYITWGGNFTLGGGYRFSPRFAVLGEYQFIDDKLPGAFVTAGGGTTGDAHINSLTVDPVIELFPKASNSVYVTGGGGWYHKSTNFNVEECCDFYGYPVTVTANSFSSNQMGASLGIGFDHRFAGMYGDGNTRLFAEARYLYIHTPAITQTNGLGTTELIPVTIGVRF